MTHDKLEDVPLDEVKRTFDTNIFGTFALTQAALKKLKARWSPLFEHNFDSGITTR